MNERLLIIAAALTALTLCVWWARISRAQDREAALGRELIDACGDEYCARLAIQNVLADEDDLVHALRVAERQDVSELRFDRELSGDDLSPVIHMKEQSK